MRFRYIAADNSPASLMPRLPLVLTLGGRSIEVTGLLDTGSTVNVLPFRMGLELGAVWEEQTESVSLAGNLGQYEARALVVRAFHPQITTDGPILFVFAWTRVENAPVIFGQMNFFLEFDVCFYRSLGIFDVRLKGNGS